MLHDDRSLTLRPAEISDIDAIYSLQTDRAAAMLAGVEGQFVDADTFRGRMVEAIEGKAGKKLFVQEVGGTFAGYVGCFQQGSGYSLSYWIGRAYWGQGVGTYMLTRLFELLPADITDGEMTAEVVEGNDASMRLLKHFGFEEVGQRTFVCAVNNVERTKKQFRRPPTET